MMLSDQVLSLLTSVSALKYYYIFQKLDISNYLYFCYVQSTTLKIDSWVMN